MLNIQNKCPYGSYETGSGTLEIFKIEIFVTIVRCPVINYSTKSSILNITTSLYCTCSTTCLGGSITVYSRNVPFRIEYNSCVSIPAPK